MITPQDLLNSLDADGPQPEKKVETLRDKRIKELYAAAHMVNRAGREYTPGELDNYAKMYNLNISTVEDIFVRVHEDFKDEFGLDEKPEIFKVELFLKKKYDFIRNEVTQTMECKLKTEKDFKKVNVDSLFRDMQGCGFKFPLDKLKSLLRSDFVQSYNPFVAYFDILPAWDGIDYIDQLAGFVKTPDQEFFNIQFKKALVRSIACSVGLKENRIVMVFVGEKQEAGKSTFIRFLNPFGNKYYTESPIRDNKDSEFRFSENFIYNLEELSSLNNIEVNKLKAIISKSVIKERKPYAADEEEQPRRCNFWGSTNKIEFLIDTENTRWLCFNIDYIKWDYKKSIDINMVWAQAWALYNSGFDYQLTKEERIIRDSKNKTHELSSSEKELILLHYRPCDKGQGEFMLNAQILDELIQKTGSRLKLNTTYLGRALTQLGFVPGTKKIKGKIFRGYFLTKITLTDFDMNGIPGDAGIPDDTIPF